MRELDRSAIKVQIEHLMKERQVTQNTLSKEIGMTQPNFSRALKQSSKQCFTLEQLYKIAQYFHVSVDYLLGNDQPFNLDSEKGICRFFTTMLEDRKLVTAPYVRNEKCMEPFYNDQCPPDVSCIDKEVSYHTFFFPKHWDTGPLDRYSEDEIETFRDIAWMDGNLDDSNVRINAFFDKYLQIYDMYLHNQITKELFHEIMEKFMEDLH